MSVCVGDHWDKRMIYVLDLSHCSFLFFFTAGIRTSFKINEPSRACVEWDEWRNEWMSLWVTEGRRWFLYIPGVLSSFSPPLPFTIFIFPFALPLVQYDDQSWWKPVVPPTQSSPTIFIGLDSNNNSNKMLSSIAATYTTVTLSWIYCLFNNRMAEY